MRYKIEYRKAKTGEAFAPYSVTLHIDSVEDHKIIHDHVATRIAHAGGFIGAVYTAKFHDPEQRFRFPLSGTIPLKKHDPCTGAVIPPNEVD